MEKRINSRKTLSGLLIGYLVRTGLGCLAVCALWFGLILILITAGVLLPANSAATAALEAEDVLSTMSADHFDADALSPLCRWVLLDTTVSPGSIASHDQVLGSNIGGRDLDRALQLDSPVIRSFYYRDVRLIDGTLCRLQYSFGATYAAPELRRVLPDFELCWLGILLVLLAVMVLLSTRHTVALLRQETDLLTNACRTLAGGDLSGDSLGHARLREFDQALRTMEGLRQELADSLKCQWVMEQQRSERLAALAHDLKTPLAIVRGNAELLAEDSLPDAQRSFVDAILRGADRAGQYLAALRSAIQAEHSTSAPEPIDAAAFAASLADTGTALCAPRGISFRMQTDFPEGFRLRAQRQNLGRAVENLLANAARFAPEDGHVTLTCRVEEGFVLFAVQDDGPGFPPEILSRGGQLLQTGDASRSDGHQGLGLFLARTVAEAHGGSLHLENAGGALAVLHIRQNAFP